MGIRSQGNTVISYRSVWESTGIGAVNDPIPVVAGWTGARYVSFGGSVPGAITNIMDYVTIANTGNASDFGDLSQGRQGPMAVSNGTRGICAGGYGPQGSAAYVNTMDYIAFATTGNAQDFGDLLYVQGFGSSTMSSVRGVWFGGYGGTPGGSPGQGYKDWIQYTTMATLGNSVDFGDLTFAYSGTGACTNGTRGCVGGGWDGSNNHNVIDYITIASTGNGTDFGDLTQARRGVAACGSDTRGVFGSGQTPSNSNVLDYITIASTGNATDFGDLNSTAAGYKPAAASNLTRGLWAGCDNGPYNAEIDYVAIATTGNASDFGDLTSDRAYAFAQSGT